MQEYWSMLPFFQDQGSNLGLLHGQVDFLPLHHLGSPVTLYNLKKQKQNKQTRQPLHIFMGKTSRQIW